MLIKNIQIELVFTMKYRISEIGNIFEKLSSTNWQKNHIEFLNFFQVCISRPLCFLRRWKDPFRMIVSSSRKAKKGKTAGPWEYFQIKWGQSVEEKNAPPRWYLVKGQLISVSSNLLKYQWIFLKGFLP